jgi:hypothetical protein
MPVINAEYQIKAWDEKPFSEVESAGKITHSAIKKTFKGALEGEGVLHYLMAYHTDGTATYFGFERISGKLGGKAGTFVMRHDGVFANGKADTKFTIVAGSGTGALKGISGQGASNVGHMESYPMTLDYHLG